MAEFGHSIDSYPTTTEVVQSKQGAPSALSVLNDELSKVGLKAELPEVPKTIIERIQQSETEAFIKKGMEIPSGGIKVWLVKDDIYAIQASKAGVSTFRRANGDIIMHLAQEAKSPFVKNYKNPEINDGKGITEAWYIEKKEDGVWNLYELIGMDQKGERVLGKKLDPKSPEYFQAWRDIVFFANTLNVLFRFKHNEDIPEQGIKNLTEGGSIKFETLELLLKKWLITQEVFNIGIIEMRKILVSQCQDGRFDGFNAESELGNNPELIKLWTRVKESDLKRYYEKWYVDEKLVAQCFTVLPTNLRDVSGGKK